MTSKERVMRAVNHEEVDKIPVDLGGSVQSTIHVYAYAVLKEALGIESGDVEVSDCISSLQWSKTRYAIRCRSIPCRFCAHLTVWASETICQKKSGRCQTGS